MTDAQAPALSPEVAAVVRGMERRRVAREACARHHEFSGRPGDWAEWARAFLSEQGKRIDAMTPPNARPIAR